MRCYCFERLVFDPVFDPDKQCVVNVISTEFKKVGCNRIDNTDIGVIKLVIQSSLKCHITVIG